MPGISVLNIIDGYFNNDKGNVVAKKGIQAVLYLAGDRTTKITSVTTDKTGYFKFENVQAGRIYDVVPYGRGLQVRHAILDIAVPDESVWDYIPPDNSAISGNLESA